ncbi:MAG: N-acetylmuramoyl-L-alanine amidase [Acidobacteriia bacterium]|nr:N-acetylmuramoyl-L-alanine amidase [Terriglobia bacterium]
MKRIAALFIAVPLLLAQGGNAPLLSVTAVRHWTVEGVTRVAVEVSGEFQYRSDRLHNPERVYFDVLNSRPRIASRRVYTESLQDSRLQRIRVAETEPGVTRVVLDLADGVAISPSQLSNPSRLIIELRASAPAPTLPPPAVNAPERLPEPPVVQPRSQELPAAVKPIAATVPPPPAATPPPAPPAAQFESKPELRAKAEAAPAAPPEIPKAARRTSGGENSLIRTLGLKVSRVVIDPGHGGHDQGTEGPHGLLEKDLVLDIATRVGKLVQDRMGAEVIYTRSDDTFVPLEGRTALANDVKADLFLSIHANSSPAPRVAGVETFYLNITGSKDALDVAARENAISQKSVFELADLIQKIARRDKAEESKEFAGRIQTALYAFSAKNIPGSRNRGVKSAPFVVLIGANMPSVLAEVGFLSNTREEALLRKPDYRQKLAEALYRGVARYADGLSHFQMALTPTTRSATSGRP